MSQSGGHGLVGHLVTFKATSISHVCFFVSRSKGCSAPFAACDLPALTEALLQNFSRHGLVWIPSNQTPVFSAFDTYVLSCQIWRVLAWPNATEAFHLEVVPYFNDWASYRVRCARCLSGCGHLKRDDKGMGKRVSRKRGSHIQVERVVISSVIQLIQHASEPSKLWRDKLRNSTSIQTAKNFPLGNCNFELPHISQIAWQMLFPRSSKNMQELTP